MARPKKKDRPEEKLYIYGSKFQIQKDRKKGVLKIGGFRHTTANAEPTESSLPRIPLVSCWIDPKKNVAVKAHGILVRTNTMHKSFYNKLKRCGIAECDTDMVVSTDFNWIVRYGSKSGYTYTAMHYDGDNTRRYNIYDTKSHALRDLIENVAHYQTVGGLEMLSLNSVSDSVLVEFGYVKIPDMLKRGPAMWLGMPELVTDSFVAEEDAYSYHKARESRVEGARMFLKRLQRELEVSSGK